MIKERQRVTRRDTKGRILQKGEGQDKNGRYYYNYMDINGKRKRIYNTELTELRKAERIIQKNIDDGIDIDAGKRTLNEQFEIYLAYKNIKETTKLQYRGRWNAHIAKVLGDKKLNNIKKSDIQLFYKQLSDEGLKDTSIKAYSHLLHPLLESAVNDDIIRKNPSKGCLQEYNNRPKERKALTLEQQDMLLDFIRTSKKFNKYFPFIMFALATACRKGEIIGITWDDIDMKNRTISINHQLRYISENGKAKYIVSSPKTETGIRDIPMTEKCYKALVMQKEYQLNNGIDHNLRKAGIGNFVFTTSSGTPYTPSNVNAFIENIVRTFNEAQQNKAIENNSDIQLLPHITCHTLRHTACTRLAESNIDIKVLQRFMGHADIKTTMNIYNHVDYMRMKTEIEKAERISRVI